MDPDQVIEVGHEPPPIDCTGAPRKLCGKRVRGKSNTTERFSTINNFVDFSLAALTGAEIAVWLILWRDTRYGVARTAQTDLARRAGVNVRTVRRAIERLHDLELLQFVHRGGLGRRLSTYRVHPFHERSQRA